MHTVYYVLVLLACSVIMGLFGFWVGRCTRKLPIIDDNLPWTLHRGQAPVATQEPEKQDSPALRWPHSTLRMISQATKS